MRRTAPALFSLLLAVWLLSAFLLSVPVRGDKSDAPQPVKPSLFRLPAGWSIEKVAGPPLVEYPMFACLDDRGRLLVAEGSGKNVPGSELEKLLLGKITLLEDTDGEDRKSVV